MFWALMKTDPVSGCTIWTKARNEHNYGTLRVVKSTTLAHRYAWTLANGPIPEGACVLHRCDNPPCCNPDHLFLGTQLENIVDRESKNRGGDHRGVLHGKARLTEAQVLEIRALKASGIRTFHIADRFGIDRTHCHAIIKRKIWRHL